jgi:hypothetical protein
MSTTTTAQSAVEKIKEAERVRDELCAALHGAGIVLPSLRIDPVAYADEKPRLLVELGRCNLQTVRQLTAALVSKRQG